MMKPNLRKLMLTAHIISSVGWLGAVTCFLALSISGLTSRNAQLVNATYLTMDLIAWYVIVPLSATSPLTGIIQSIGTPWGLFRHYWVLTKFIITIPACILLLVHLQPIGHLARAVAERRLSGGDLAGMRLQLAADASVATIILVITTALSVYKPKGMTPYGWRKQQKMN